MEELQAWLEDEGLTQAEFGEMFVPPVSQPSVSKWFKRGRVSRRCLPQASRITGIPHEHLDPETWGDE